MLNENMSIHIVLCRLFMVVQVLIHSFYQRFILVSLSIELWMVEYLLLTFHRIYFKYNTKCFYVKLYKG